MQVQVTASMIGRATQTRAVTLQAGSTNLDFRSFVFNAECDLLMLDEPTAAVMEKAFLADLENAAEIRPEEWRRRPWAEKLRDRVARWMSPVL